VNKAEYLEARYVWRDGDIAITKPAAQRGEAVTLAVAEVLDDLGFARAAAVRAVVATELLALGFGDYYVDDPVGEHDDATLALLDAMEAIDADNGRAFNPKQPRYPKGHPLGGKFMPIAEVLKGKLVDHLAGKGKGDPFDGFSREQLRKAAKARGIALKRGEDRDSIARKLLNDLGAAPRPTPKPRPRKPKSSPPVETPPSKYGTPAGRGVRETLAQASTLEEINDAARREAERLGASTSFEFRTGGGDLADRSLEVAREHAEGILRGLERFPNANVHYIGMFNPAHDPYGNGMNTYAYALPGRGSINFNMVYGQSSSEARYRRSLQSDSTLGFHPRGTDTPIGVAAHEFGHVLDMNALQSTIHAEADAIWRRYDGPNRTQQFGAPVSRYAAKNTNELVAEAFADVVMNGDSAQAPSKEIYDLLLAAYQDQFGGSTP
jgi:hypothetical protein